MKFLNHMILAFISCLTIVACVEPSANNGQASADAKSVQKSTEENSIFKELRDKVDNMEDTEYKDLLTKEDGSNVFDEVLKEIGEKDAESGGQVSGMIENILRQAEEELGVDFTETMKDALDNQQEISEFLKEGIEALNEEIEGSIGQDGMNNIMEGLQDFINTSGNNGGMEKIMEEMIKMERRNNPGAPDPEWVEKMEEIINNDEKSFEKEVENQFRKILENNQDLLEKMKEAS